jgi:hypothetical protein
MSYRGAPNTRVQRTRSSPSALRSPLTRHPLGGAVTARGKYQRSNDSSSRSAVTFSAPRSDIRSSLSTTSPSSGYLPRSRIIQALLSSRPLRQIVKIRTSSSLSSTNRGCAAASSSACASTRNQIAANSASSAFPRTQVVTNRDGHRRGTIVPSSQSTASGWYRGPDRSPGGPESAGVMP